MKYLIKSWNGFGYALYRTEIESDTEDYEDLLEDYMDYIVRNEPFKVFFKPCSTITETECDELHESDEWLYLDMTEKGLNPMFILTENMQIVPLNK